MADLRPPLAGGFSLWLEPDEETGQVFDVLIKKLAEAHKGDSFAPHITLLSMLDWSEERAEVAQDLLATLVERFRPFTLEFTGIGFRDTYFQSLFLPVVPAQPLVALRRMTATLFEQPAHPYMPHASLYYGDLSVTQKQKIVADLIAEVPQQQAVQSISLISAKGYPCDWEVVARFPLAN